MMRIHCRRRPALVAGAVLAAALTAPPLHAQDPLGEPARERIRERVEEQERDADQERCICFDRDMARTTAPLAFRSGRARIGVMLGEPAEANGRTGVRIESVVEGGPADRAGLAAGDVVLDMDGEALGDAPRRALVERMGEVEPGDTVALRYSRDGRLQTVRVVAEKDEGFAFFRPGEAEGLWSLSRPGAQEFRWGMPEGAPRVITIDAFGHGGLELVPVNPDLGRYFGVEQGVLVAAVAEESGLGLRAGDVIVAVGDREVRSPRHARSIIGSYLPDEEIPFRVVRDRRTIEVRGTRGGTP